MEGLDKLPAWIQVAVFLGVLVATTVASASGWLRDKWPKRMLPTSSPAPGKDAVVMSAAIADSAAIHNLAGAINRLCDRLEEDAETQQARDRTLRACLMELLEGTDRNSALLRQVLHPFALHPPPASSDRGD